MSSEETESTTQSQSRSTDCISSRFGVNINDSEAEKYKDLEQKSRSLGNILGGIMMLLLFIAMILILQPIFDIADTVIPVLGLALIIGFFVMEILQRPLNKKRSSIGVTRNELAQYEFNKAIDYYNAAENDEDYDAVMDTLSELTLSSGSNIKSVTSKNGELKRYIRKLEKADRNTRNQHIKDDFPEIAESVITEQNAKKNTFYSINTLI